MELSTLKVFQAVALAGSVTRAAAQLNCVQPNVSLRIRQLEEELGTTLFHRKPRGVCLTSAGKTLLRYADRLFALVAEAGEAMQEEKAPKGVLNIGCTMAFAAYRLPRILQRFMAAHSQVQVLPVTGTSKSLVDKVMAYELDGAFVNGALDNEHLDQQTVLEDELVLVTAQNAPPVRDMTRRVALVFPPGCAYRINLEYWLQRNGLLPYEISEVGSLEGILGCVAAGIGFSMLTRHIVENCPQARSLRIHPLPEQLRALPVVFIQRKQRINTRASEEFLRFSGPAPEAMPSIA